MDKCPKCHQSLVDGFINNRSAILSWSHTDPGDSVSATWEIKDDQIRLAKYDHDHGWSVHAMCCPKCKMIFVPYDEITIKTNQE